MDDSALLRRYAGTQSDDAFAGLVARHVNLVYSVALRQTGNADLAEEITQAVFIILAKKAAGLRHEKALSSWLFQTTRLTANNVLRREMRRQHREQEAYHMQTVSNEPEPELWPKIAPLLDAAVAALQEKDRRAILLRYYEGKNLREIGTVLGGNEDAARMRVGRALEKLRNYFFKRGVTSTAETIAGAISANTIQPAPAALAKTATALALAKGVAVSASTAALVKGALNVMAWAKMKTTLITSACVLLAGAIIVSQITWHKNSPPMAAIVPDAPVKASPPQILVIGGQTRANYFQTITSISPDGATDIAKVNGPVYMGMDEDTIVMLEYAAWPGKPGDGNRLLVLNRKSNAVITDRIVKGISPIMLKSASNVMGLAVRSKESTVYLPDFDRQGFHIMAINWQTGAVHRMDVPFTEDERGWEIDYLYTVPSGIAIPRGPFFTIYDPATQTVVLRFNNIGPDLRPTGTYYFVPGFGIVFSSSDGTFSRLTQSDFSTVVTNPVSFPFSEVNRDKYQPRIGREIDGKPCLMWGENEAGVDIRTNGISQIVLCNLDVKKEVRESLGGNFAPGFLPDDAGKKIYFTDLTREKIFCLDLESQKITQFADMDHPIGFIDAN